ncbi:MAG TPA: hypothetical protein VG826_21570 [Pirellulales bacterium]|nr:hypothetical protein [Pirellulales bacterium]
MRRCTHHSLVYASIVAFLFLELSSIQQGDVPTPGRTAAEVGASTEIGIGPLLFRPRVAQPSAASISVPAVNSPGAVTTSQVGHLPLAPGEILSLQEEHIRLQI